MSSEHPRYRVVIAGGAPPDLDPADVEEMVERWIAHKRTQQLGEEEIARRRARGRMLRAQHARDFVREDSDREQRP